MENQAAATRREKDDDNDDVGSGSDRISRLPESVLLHILCFLSQKKAVQTSVLSKSWRHLGPTRPIIDFRGRCTDHRYHTRGDKFCENCFIGNNEEFLSVLDKTFQRYDDRNLSPRELRLHVLGFDSQSISVLEKWIPVFIKPNSGVTTFHLSVFNNYNKSADRAFLDLPSSVLKAESLKNLRLHQCKISSIIQTHVVLKNLQKLDLSDVYIDNQTLGKIMSGCPFIEYAGLYNCNGFKTITIDNVNQHLKEFNLTEFNLTGAHIELGDIEIHTPSLESIRINMRSNLKLDRHNCFPHLKSLDLSRVQLPTELFEYFSCNFPLLEKLRLYQCRGFEEIKLFCRLLKHLTISVISSIKVDINAPNIIDFMFYGSFLPTTISFATTSKEWKSYIALNKSDPPYGDALPRFLKLNEMLKAVSQSKITLHISDSMFHQSQLIECGIHDHPVVVEKLEIYDLDSNFNPIPCLFYALFQICRPRHVITRFGLGSSSYINGLFGSESGELLDCIWETLKCEGENKVYYWHQHLEEVSIEDYDFKEKVWLRVKGPPRTLKYRSYQQEAIIPLKWND